MKLETPLSEYHRCLRPSYTEKDAGTKANCVSIAYDIARQLIKQDLHPRIYEVKPDYDQSYPQPGLTVKSFRSVTFHTHFFAYVENQAYDPIHTRTLPVADYVEQTFKEHNLSLTLRASSDEVREELERRPHRYHENKLVR